MIVCSCDKADDNSDDEKTNSHKVEEPIKERLRTTVYTSPLSSQQFRAIADYTLADGSPAINVVCIFAGNYAASTPPYLRANNNKPPTSKPFNDNIQQVLDDGSVQYLQSKGIIVLLSILNGHQSVGWSQFTSQSEVTDFVQYLKKDVVDKYGLDGIDIDDEYSLGKPNDTSLSMVSTLMQEAMPDKMITKALFADLPYFQLGSGNDRLANNFKYGWEMSYGGSASRRIEPYTQYGLKKDQLSLGFWATAPPAALEEDVKWLKDSGYAGVMVFEFEKQANRDLMGTLVNSWLGPGNWNTP